MRQPHGQNFLVDKTIASAIVEAGGLSADDTVLEIGPGHGVLTGLIAPQVKELYAVEIDGKLAAELQRRFSGQPHVHIVNQDFLSYDAPLAPSSLKVLANLPYNVATPILGRILPLRSWLSAVVMVQKEVGDRITACRGTKHYGYFSLFCQYYADAEIIMNVGPEAFHPRPDVHSTVVRLINKLPPPPEELLFTLIKYAFQHRRKTILNALAHTLQCPKEEILSVLRQLAIDPMLRPERLDLQSYQTLTYHLKRYIIGSTFIKKNDKT